MRKTTTRFFNISKFYKKINKRNYVSGILWAFKSKLQIILQDTYIALLLPDSNNCFICIVPYIHICFFYFFILCFYFHLLSLVRLSTKHILQFTMFDTISLQPARNITEMKKYFIVYN